MYTYPISSSSSPIYQREMKTQKDLYKNVQNSFIHNRPTLKIPLVSVNW